MKKLIGFLIVAGVVACNCMSQIPMQYVYIDENCEAILPDYRSKVRIRDNCVVTDTLQYPAPGTLIDFVSGIINVQIDAIDGSQNVGSIDFDVMALDTTPPVIEYDSLSSCIEWEDQSILLKMYHNNIGKLMHAAAQGPDSILTQSLLRDTSYWEPNPWLDADSTFDTNGMVVRWEPGFDGTSVGSFIDHDKYMLANIDSNHLKTLGIWPVMTVIIGVEQMPLTMDIAGPTDNTAWLTQEFGGPVYKFVEKPWNLNDMYASERFGIFRYKIPTGEGTFKVDLHFCEIYWKNSGERVFDVNIQGKRVLTNFDIVAEVGPWVPLVKTFTTTVEWAGFLEIDFPIALVNYAKLSGITITKIGQAI
jgi:hypothetical protein